MSIWNVFLRMVPQEITFFWWMRRTIWSSGAGRCNTMIYRPFCKYLCPLGAIYGIFNRFSLYHYEIDGINERENLCPIPHTGKTTVKKWIRSAFSNESRFYVNTKNRLPAPRKLPFRSPRNRKTGLNISTLYVKHYVNRNVQWVFTIHFAAYLIRLCSCLRTCLLV